MYQLPTDTAALIQTRMGLEKLASQASTTAAGPEGRIIPTVAGRTIQEAQQATGADQGADLSSLASNAATGANIQGMQQQQAQEALMKQMLAQQQAQAQQPVLAAEGGIASLDVGGMDDYAEGGVVGFSEGGAAKTLKTLFGLSDAEIARLLGSQPSSSAADDYIRAEEEALRKQAAQHAAEASKQAGEAYTQAEKELLRQQAEAARKAASAESPMSKAKSFLSGAREALQPGKLNPSISGEGVLKGLKGLGSLAGKAFLPLQALDAAKTATDLAYGPASDTENLRKYYGYGPAEEGISGLVGDIGLRGRYAVESMIPFMGPSAEELTGKQPTAARQAAPVPSAPAAPEQAEDLAKQEAVARGMQQFMGQGSGAGQEERAKMPPSAGSVAAKSASQRTEAAPAAQAPAAQGPQLDTAQIDAVFNKYVQRPELSGLKGLVEQYNQMLGDRPDYEANKLRAINEAYEKEKAARAWNRFMGGLEAPYRGIGSFYTNFEAKAREADLANALKQTEMSQEQRKALREEMAARIEASKLVPGIEAQYAPSQMSLASNVMTGVGALQREEMQRRANLEREELQRRANLELERLRQSGAEQAANRPSEFMRLYRELFPNEPVTLENVEKVKRAMSPALEDKEVARQAALALKKKELLEKNMTYKLLDAQLKTAKTPEDIARIQNQMSAIERGYGIGNIDTGADQRKVIDFSSIGAQ